jgi:cystathionine beta-lyase/cystathionine gamma-synthase
MVEGSKGENIVIDKYMYFEITAMLTMLCKKMSVELRVIDVSNDEDLLKALDEETRLVLIETPTNPLQRVISIEGISVKIKENAPGAEFVVDNTMLSPYFQDCFKHGADMAMYSITKHIAGHGDVMGGYITGREELIQKFRRVRNLFGIIMRPMDAWLTLRGLKTFCLRMEKQETNTHHVYEYLKEHKRIKKIYTTRDKSRKDSDVIEYQQTGHGTVLVIEIDGDSHKCERFIRELKLFRIATTFGNAESIVYHFKTFAPPTADLAGRGENDRMIRLAIGLESVEDIIKDLDNALKAIDGMVSCPDL